MKNKYNAGDRVRARIHYRNDNRKEVEATIVSIELNGDSVKYRINFEPEEYDRKQGCTGCEGYINQDDIIK